MFIFFISAVRSLSCSCISQVITLSRYWNSVVACSLFRIPVSFRIICLILHLTVSKVMILVTDYSSSLDFSSPFSCVWMDFIDENEKIVHFSGFFLCFYFFVMFIIETPFVSIVMASEFSSSAVLDVCAGFSWWFYLSFILQLIVAASSFVEYWYGGSFFPLMLLLLFQVFSYHSISLIYHSSLRYYQEVSYCIWWCLLSCMYMRFLQ